MGQRLNIEIKEHDKIQANYYYHWSAYTSSSAKITQCILSKIEECKELSPIQRSIRLLEATGAGFASNAKEKALLIDELKGFSLKDTTGRSDGLIAVDEVNMKETRDWEEGRVTIDLDNKTVDFGVFFLETTEEFNEWRKIDINTLPKINFDLSNIPFDKFDEFIEEVTSVVSIGFRCDSIDKVITPIE